MIQSMTGFGRGECSRGGKRLILQVSSVNHRHCDLRFTLARELCYLEKPLRDCIREYVQRGSLQLVVELVTDHSVPGQVRANLGLARDYLRETQRLREELGIAGEVTLQELLLVPGIFQVSEPEASPETVVDMAVEAAHEALRAMLLMRQTEGESLRVDMQQRLDFIAEVVGRIGSRAPLVPQEYRGRLMQRIAEILQEPTIDQDRLMKEVAWFADKADISEEITRLSSHIEQLQALLNSCAEPVGRKLDFLLQEMHREINTIGSKANDQGIGGLVVDLKAELERMREQAQNVQ